MSEVSSIIGGWCKQGDVVIIFCRQPINPSRNYIASPFGAITSWSWEAWSSFSGHGLGRLCKMHTSLLLPIYSRNSIPRILYRVSEWIPEDCFALSLMDCGQRFDERRAVINATNAQGYRCYGHTVWYGPQQHQCDALLRRGVMRRGCPMTGFYIRHWQGGCKINVLMPRILLYRLECGHNTIATTTTSPADSARKPQQSIN